MSKKIKSLSFIDDIKRIIEESRKYVYKSVNATIVKTNWLIGRRIVLEEQNGEKNAKYGDFIISNISRELTKKFGKGYSKTNIKMFRRFYIDLK